MKESILLDIPAQQRSVEDYGNPISVNQEEEGKEAVYGSLGYDVRVQPVTELNRIDIIAGKTSLCQSPLRNEEQAPR